MTKPSALTAIAAGVLWFAAAGAHADDLPRYNIERVPVPPSFQPSGMNERGDIVGFKMRSGWTSDYVAYRQLAGSTPQTVADAPGGKEMSQLVAVNDSGLAVGYVNVDPVEIEPGLFSDGFRVDVVQADGQRIDLSPLLPEGVDSFAVDVNSRGDVAGTMMWWSTVACDYVYKPFVWSESEGMRFPLGTGIDGPQAHAAAINDAGQLAGRAIDPAGSESFYIFAWDAQRGARYSERMIVGVSDANNLGQVVGVTLNKEAYVWTAGGGKKRLPRPDGQPNTRCRANAINDAGVIVGTCTNTFEAVAWLPGEDGSYRIIELWKHADVPPDFPIWRYPKGERPVPAAIANDGRILLTNYIGDPPLSYGNMYPQFSVIMTPKP